MSELTNLIQKLKDPDIEKADKVIAIHNTCKSYQWIKEVFLMTYDPYYQYYIKTKFPKLIDNSNKNESNLIDLNANYWITFLKPFLLKLNKREYDTKTYTNIINNQLNILSNENQDIFKNIIFKDLRVGFAAKSINNAIGEELIPVSGCQLCKTWDINMNIKNVDGFWASRKLNGLRGQFKNRNGNYVFLTREELPLIGFDEIEKELNQLQVQYDLSLIDGEIFNINLPFQSIISVVRGEKNFDPEQKKLLKFNIFNIQKNNIKWKNTKEMIDFIEEIFKKSNYNYITPLKYEYVKNNSIDIINKCKEYTNEGYEGIVLRDPIVSFEPGKRNNHLLKYKLFNECDLIVKDILFGAQGKKWENSIAALLCEGIVRCKKIQIGNDILYQPISLDEKLKESDYIDIQVSVEAACSSLTDKEREELTNTPKDQIIGKTIEVKFQSITDKPNEEGIYSLQFPVFQKFKDIK